MGALPNRIRIATRESSLAMRQAEMAGAALAARHPGLAIELVGMSTRGDRVLDRPLSQVGGKGLFVKELEVALAEDRADIAVHSMKDVPMDLPEGFALRTFGPREDPLDAFVSNRFAGLDELPEGAVVGTSSLRRECQLRHAFGRLEFRPLRGNVNTRLARLDRGEYDAIILAVAGLKRLGLAERIRSKLPATISLPAICQGVLGVEYRAERSGIGAMLDAFEHRETAVAARAERALGRVVEGSCEVPLAAYARVDGGAIEMEAFVGLPDASRSARERASGRADDAEALGHALGERLLAAGGREILRLLESRAA